MPKTPESELKQRIIRELRANGVCCIPVPGGPYGLPGAPDYILCYKGWFIGMEGKTSSGRQRIEQSYRQEDIEKAGGCYVLAKDITHVWKVLEKIDE